MLMYFVRFWETATKMYLTIFIFHIFIRILPINGIETKENTVCGKINAKNNSRSEIISNLKYSEDKSEIIGQNRWPWLAVIYEYDYGDWKNVCFGTIISPHIIITAAQCFYDEIKFEAKDRSLFKVVIGNLSELSDHIFSAKQFQISSIHINEDYSGVSTDYDGNIALIGLSNNIEFGDIRPVCLDWDGTGVIANSSLGIIATWNILRQAKKEVNIRLKEVKYISRKNCIKLYPSSTFFKYLNYDQFCVILNSKRTDEDMGTGVVSTKGGTSYLKGILGVNVGSEFLIATNISVYLTWIKEKSAAIDVEKRCVDANGFLCSNKCIEGHRKCDSVPDCDDGSDENEISCGNKQTNDTCALPEQKGGAIYRLIICDGNDKNCIRNSLEYISLYTKMRIICSVGYATPVDKSDLVICTPEGWFPDNPECIKLCKPLKKKNLEIKCTFEGSNIGCDKYMKPGTIASYTCKTDFKIVNPLKYNGYSTCSLSGDWVGLFPNCTPECGFIQNFSKPLYANFTENGHKKSIYYGKHPWSAGLFLIHIDHTTPVRFICSGAIITHKTLLMVSHCVKAFKPHLYIIGAGKLLTDANATEPYQQYRKIKKISLPEINPVSSYERDIALVDVDEPFDINNYVAPICIDWKKYYIPTGTIGRVVGWGLNYKSGAKWDHLQEIDLPVINIKACREKYPDWNQHASYDKFCGLYNGTIGPRQGSSGSAMMIRRGDIYYVYGVLSSAVSNGGIDSSTFTNITNHLKWIKNHIKPD